MQFRGLLPSTVLPEAIVRVQRGDCSLLPSNSTGQTRERPCPLDPVGITGLESPKDVIETFQGGEGREGRGDRRGYPSRPLDRDGQAKVLLTGKDGFEAALSIELDGGLLRIGGDPVAARLLGSPATIADQRPADASPSELTMHREYVDMGRLLPARVWAYDQLQFADDLVALDGDQRPLTAIYDAADMDGARFGIHPWPAVEVPLESTQVLVPC